MSFDDAVLAPFAEFGFMRRALVACLAPDRRVVIEAIGTVMRDPIGRTRTPTSRRHEISATLSPLNSSFSSPNRFAPMPIEMRCVAVAL